MEGKEMEVIMEQNEKLVIANEHGEITTNIELLNEFGQRI